MTASHWTLLVLGLLAGGTIGFFLGRVTAGISAAEVDAAKLESIDKKADADRAAVDAEVARRAASAPTMNEKELLDALEHDFALPPDHPLRQPPSK